ncbi:phage holin family protein [Paraburkholderia hospita]|uniref:phage holin family protein n=1 Tax=Paraburkholderia hospita TaxID=169430 RepID=UPI001F45DDFF|nr:phage holin family protein [Paraburkholderia hospita]
MRRTGSARADLVREVIALVALAEAGLFALAFPCIVIIVTALRTPYCLHLAWALAAAWLLVCVVSFVFIGFPAGALCPPTQDQIRDDLRSVREALK